ncbi:MAG TPA: hypothetical protein VFQ82_10900 [Stellaceae bacterium]|jgi:hypothetical protein|nr:hypothetical protein [Stellaceae bacterium]
MATYVEGRSAASDVEPVGLVSEGVAGIAAIVLAVIALAGVSSGILASIVTIIIGVGLMVQAFNSAAEASRMAPAGVSGTEVSGEVMVDCLTGIAGIILGVLALVGINAAHLVPAAVIVFGGALMLSGALELRPVRTTTAATTAGPVQIASYRGSTAAGGMEILIGIAAIVLGVLSLIFMASWILVLVGFIAIGAAMLMVSATFGGAVMRLFTTTA